MIITVTLNAAIDKTLAVPNFRLGRRHRTVDQTTMPGGKGVNVARALKALGRPVIATGLTGGPTGTRIVEALTAESIICSFVRIKEESRTNMAVIDPTSGVRTEINERGPSVTAEELALFRDKLRYLAQGAAVCVLAGTLPRGLEAEVYADLVNDLHELGVKAVVEADGDPLRQAVKAEPDLIVPSLMSAEELVGHEFVDDDDLIKGVAQLSSLGSREAIVVLDDGCIACLSEGGDRQIYRAHVGIRNEQVAPGNFSDALIAGYIAAGYSGEAPVESFRFAVACAADSTRHFGAGVLEESAVRRLLDGIELEKLDLPTNVA